MTCPENEGGEVKERQRYTGLGRKRMMHRVILDARGSGSEMPRKWIRPPVANYYYIHKGDSLNKLYSDSNKICKRTIRRLCYTTFATGLFRPTAEN